MMTTNARMGGNQIGKFATVLSSDSVGPEEYCMLAYQDSETDLQLGGASSQRGRNSDAYAAQRLPARRKSTHKKSFLEPHESDTNTDLINFMSSGEENNASA